MAGTLQGVGSGRIRNWKLLLDYSLFIAFIKIGSNPNRRGISMAQLIKDEQINDPRSIFIVKNCKSELEKS